MANTWTVWNQAKTFVAGGAMVGLMNAGARVLRVRRIGYINDQTVAVTGVVVGGEIRRYTGAGWTTPTALTPVSHDTTNSALSSVTAGHAGTPTGTSAVLRRYFASSDEPKLSTLQNNELEAIIPFGVIWDAGYGDSNVQPLTLRTNESVIVWNVTGAAGAFSWYIEFTDEAS